MRTFEQIVAEKLAKRAAEREAELSTWAARPVREQAAATAFAEWVAAEIGLQELPAGWLTAAREIECDTYAVALRSVHMLEPTLHMTLCDGEAIGWRERSQCAWQGWRVRFNRGGSELYTDLVEALIRCAGIDLDAVPAPWPTAATVAQEAR